MSTPASTSLTIAIMAGGASRRMGRDKASIVFEGRRLLERIAAEAVKTGYPVVIVGRTQPADWPLPNTTFIFDDTPSLGPLEGLATVLRRTSTYVMALACDMPLLQCTAIVWLIEQTTIEAREHGVAVTGNGEVEPLFSVYPPSLLPMIEERLATGRRSMKGLLDDGRFTLIDAPAWVARQLKNVNSEEDLRELIQ